MLPAHAADTELLEESAECPLDGLVERPGKGHVLHPSTDPIQQQSCQISALLSLGQVENSWKDR